MPITLRRAYAGIGAIFALAGFLFGTWAARIPDIKRAYQLDDGTLGLLLLCIAIGALFAMPLAGPLAARFGSRPVITVTALGAGLGLPVVTVVADVGILAIVLLVFGALIGALDIAMNVQASFIERRSGRRIMAGLHGMFSVGGMIGALAGGLAAWVGIDIMIHFIAVDLLSLAVVGFAARKLASGDQDGGKPAAFTLPGRELLPLGLMAFTVLLTEGAVTDWSAVYLTADLHASPVAAAAGYAAFSLTMAIGRFTGDRMIERFGPDALLRAGAVLSGLGLLAAIGLGGVAAAVTGFGLVGLGLSCLFPILVSAATRIGRTSAGSAIAGVASVGYLGFLLGPPAIGFIASHFGLATAFALLVVLLGSVYALAGRAGGGEAAAAGPA
ncbi:MFS transporter [Marinivivus vitaminiproducens]|uniref:MFS transporter n=1 Tax=Marinivivus vitaminiproducens TaxID=3035935 RepID=UPI0027980CA5|nr:MFS transporter [Geminicoccaceae bacterium SCSIO 64248]